MIRTLDPQPDWTYSLSNASADEPLAELVRARSSRHQIEEVLEEGKGEVGLAHYEVRSWVGWHHHVTLALLALWFLVLERGRMGEKLQRSPCRRCGRSSRNCSASAPRRRGRSPRRSVACCGVARRRASTTGTPRPRRFRPADQGRGSPNCDSRSRKERGSLATVRIEADDLRRQMAEIRSQLHQEMREVVNVATIATDWRSYLRGRPWLAIGLAFSAGFLLVRRRSRPTTLVVQPSAVDVQSLQAAVQAEKPGRLPLMRGSSARSGRSPYEPRSRMRRIMLRTF